MIEGEPCLRSQRGRILARNSCRDPWFGTLNLRLTKAFPTVGTQSLELTADLFNLLNLINANWGLYRTTSPSLAWPLLTLRGYDTTMQRGVYQVGDLPVLKNVQDFDGRWSRWLAELSIRYVF